MAAPALTKTQVAEILARSQAGEGRAALAQSYGVSVYTVDSVRRGRTTGAKPHASRTLTLEQAASIRQRHATGETQTALATEFELSQQALSQLIRGVTYRPVNS